jgi:hypothetical protein
VEEGKTSGDITGENYKGTYARIGEPRYSQFYSEVTTRVTLTANENYVFDVSKGFNFTVPGAVSIELTRMTAKTIVFSVVFRTYDLVPGDEPAKKDQANKIVSLLVKAAKEGRLDGLAELIIAEDAVVNSKIATMAKLYLGDIGGAYEVAFEKTAPTDAPAVGTRRITGTFTVTVDGVESDVPGVASIKSYLRLKPDMAR